MAWFALSQGNAGAYKEAGKKATQAIIGFLIIVAISGGIVLAMLKYFGVKDGSGGGFNPLKLLQSISLLEVPHAYAAASVCAPPQKGDTCYFTAKGTKLVGTIRDSGHSWDLALYCEDSITELTSYTDSVGGVKYWKGQTDCTGKINGTVCDLDPAYQNRMGVCSSSYTPPDPHFTSGAADCKGKLPDTFCTPTGFVFGAAGGTCVSRTATVGEATCYPVGTGVKCLSPFNEGKVGSTDFNGAACIVVGDPCKQSDGKPGIYAQKQLGTFCVDPSTVAATNPPADSASDPASAPAAPTQLPNPLGFNSLYDFILSALSVAMKFFLYPAIIAIWVYSGFLYVAAQGAPDKLKKAHNLLLWAFISTLIVFMTQGFLTAIKGSVDKIIGS